MTRRSHASRWTVGIICVVLAEMIVFREFASVKALSSLIRSDDNIKKIRSKWDQYGCDKIVLRMQLGERP